MNAQYLTMKSKKKKNVLTANIITGITTRGKNTVARQSAGEFVVHFKNGRVYAPYHHRSVGERMIIKCPHAYTEYEENCRLDMCRLHPEKLYGVGENDCEWCLYCPDKEWQEWKHSLHPSPEPTAVRQINGSIERYEMDVETGTISCKVVQTNADRIRAMSDEELAVFLLEATSNAIVVLGIGSNGKSKNAFDWYEWLKAPAEEG